MRKPPKSLRSSSISRLAASSAPSGEIRTSNFLPWQSAYSEYYFTDVLWPDFDEAELDRAIAAYQARDRRFGGVKK